VPTIAPEKISRGSPRFSENVGPHRGKCRGEAETQGVGYACRFFGDIAPLYMLYMLRTNLKYLQISIVMSTQVPCVTEPLKILPVWFKWCIRSRFWKNLNGDIDGRRENRDKSWTSFLLG